MRSDRHEAMLERLRQKGLGLAPHMVDGRVAPKRAERRALRPAGDEKVPGKVITPERAPDALESHTAPGTVFEFTIPAPHEFLNANQRLDRWEKARRVKAWRFGACLTAARVSAPQGIERLQIDAYVIKPVANRFDPANYQDTAKAVTDGLIDYGLAEDDNRKVVEGPFMHDGGKGEPALRIVVTVLAKGLLAS